MKTATFRKVRFILFPSATASLCGMSIALGFVSAIAVPSLVSPAAAQTEPEPLPAPTRQQSSAAQLGDVVGVDCLKVQSLPIPHQSCKRQPISTGQGQQIPPDILRMTTDSINRHSWGRQEWQQDHLPLLLIPIPELF